MKILVTQSIIDAAKQSDCTDCAIDMAVADAIGFKVAINGHTINSAAFDRLEIVLPKEVQLWIEDWDNNNRRNFRPVEFEIPGLESWLVAIPRQPLTPIPTDSELNAMDSGHGGNIPLQKLAPHCTQPLTDEQAAAQP